MSDTPLQLTQEMREKLARVDFGLQVQAFLNTRIGKYLAERAATESEQKLQQLKVFDVMGNPSGAARLQCEIWRAESFMFWLAEAVTEGSDLMNQMLAEERQALGIDNANGGDPTGA